MAGLYLRPAWAVSIGRMWTCLSKFVQHWADVAQNTASVRLLLQLSSLRDNGDYRAAKNSLFSGSAAQLIVGCES